MSGLSRFHGSNEILLFPDDCATWGVPWGLKPNHTRHSGSGTQEKGWSVTHFHSSVR